MNSDLSMPDEDWSALDFLAAIDPCPQATFNIECFTDVPKGANKLTHDSLTFRRANLSLGQVEQLLPHLEALNDQGAGVFFAVNEFDGHRKKISLSKIRCVHADLDGVDEAARKALAGILPPSLAVQTSGPDNQHWYWLLEEGEMLSTDQAEAINRALVAYGADKAAVDVARLLRLPGFKHMKNRAAGDTPTVRVMAMGPRYTAEDLLSAFGPQPAPTASQLTPVPSTAPGAEGVEESLVSRVANDVRDSYPALWAGRWDTSAARGLGPPYESQSDADLAMAGHIARKCAELGIPKDRWPELVEAVFKRCGLANRPKWQERSDYRRMTIERAVSGVEERPEMTVPLESHGDIRNAKALAHRARGRLLYIATRDRWLIWQ